MEATVAHLIGTASLMALFLSVGSYYSASYTNLRYEIATVHLEKISNYFASNIVDMVSLCYMSNTNQFIIKRLEIPAYLMSYGYDVAILSTVAGGFKVSANLISDSTVYGESVLPWSADAGISIYNQTDTQINDYISTHRPSLDPDICVFSGESNIVAWCLRLDEKIIIGIGRLE